MSVNVEIVHYDNVYVTREADRSNDSWDADDVCHSHTIYGYRVIPEKSYWDFVLPNDPKGKTLYFVYALYNTGDSFHCEENVMCKVGLYEYEKDAESVMVALENDYKTDMDSFEPVKVYLPRKKTVETIGVSTWKGYFERLLNINIEPVSPVGKWKIEF